ncbi:MAG: hypothetical protein BEN18_09010 [Epulopiscium sp. Nuni2H_MBin001]|nr:MAG: hypothetical protein BEN18_09010 [Epulopiscium sp. Nuni2H_MBin001]
MAIRKFKKHLPLVVALTLGTSSVMVYGEDTGIGVNDLTAVVEYLYYTTDATDDGAYSYSNDNVTATYISDTFGEHSYIEVSEFEGADVASDTNWTTLDAQTQYKNSVDSLIHQINSLIDQIENLNKYYYEATSTGTYDEDADVTDEGEVVVSYETAMKALDTAIVTAINKMYGDGKATDAYTAADESDGTSAKFDISNFEAAMSISELEGNECAPNTNWVSLEVWDNLKAALDKGITTYNQAQSSIAIASRSANTSYYTDLILEEEANVKLYEQAFETAAGTNKIYEARNDLDLALDVAALYLNLDGDATKDGSKDENTTDDVVISYVYNNESGGNGEIKDATADEKDNLEIPVMSENNGIDVMAWYVSDTNWAKFKAVYDEALTTYESYDGLDAYGVALTAPDGQRYDSETNSSTLTQLEKHLGLLQTAQTTFLNTVKDGTLAAVQEKQATLHETIRAAYEEIYYKGLSLDAEDEIAATKDDDATWFETCFADEIADATGLLQVQVSPQGHGNDINTDKGTKWVTQEDWNTFVATINAAIEEYNADVPTESGATTQTNALKIATLTFRINISEYNESAFENACNSLDTIIKAVNDELHVLSDITADGTKVVTSDNNGTDITDGAPWVTQTEYNEFLDVFYEYVDILYDKTDNSDGTYTTTDNNNATTYSSTQLTTFASELTTAFAEFQSKYQDGSKETVIALLAIFDETIDDMLAYAGSILLDDETDGLQHLVEPTDAEYIYINTHDGTEDGTVLKYASTDDKNAFIDVINTFKSTYRTGDNAIIAGDGTTASNIADLILQVDSERTLTATSDGSKTADPSYFTPAYTGDGEFQKFNQLDVSNSKHELYNLIAEATALTTTLKTSDTNGMNVASTDRWITTDKMTELKEAIDTAQEELIKSDVNEAYVVSAKTDLQNVINNLGIVNGTGEGLASLASLQTAINNAKNSIGHTNYLDTDGSLVEYDTDDIPTALYVADEANGAATSSSLKWVTPEQMTAYEAKISDAIDSYNSASSNSELVSAMMTMNSAATEFQYSIATTPGTKESFIELQPTFKTLVEKATGDLYDEDDNLAIAVDSRNGKTTANDKAWATQEDLDEAIAALNNAKADYDKYTYETDGSTEKITSSVTYAEYNAAYTTFNNYWALFCSYTVEGDNKVYSSSSKVQWGCGDTLVPLQTAITDAKSYIYENTVDSNNATNYVPISTVNGDEYATDEYWVSKATFDTLEAAIQTAQDVLDDDDSTATEVANATATLNNAVTAFINAKQLGTGEYANILPTLETTITNAYSLILLDATYSNGEWSTTDGTSGYTYTDGKLYKISVSANGTNTNDYWVTSSVYSTYTTAISTAANGYSSYKTGAKEFDAEALQTLTTNLNGAIDTIITQVNDGVKDDADAERAALSSAISTAEALLEANPTSTTGGSEFGDEDNWVSQSTYNAYESAIATANTVASDTTYAYSVAQITQAIADLATATDKYNAGIETGPAQTPTTENLAALKSLITSSQTLRNSLKTSSNKGIDVSHNYKWITSEDLATFNANITAANTAYNNQNSSNSDIVNAYDDLLKDYNKYNAQYGVQEDTAYAKTSFRILALQTISLRNGYDANSDQYKNLDDAIAEALIVYNSTTITAVEYGYKVTKSEDNPDSNTDTIVASDDSTTFRAILQNVYDNKGAMTWEQATAIANGTATASVMSLAHEEEPAAPATFGLMTEDVFDDMEDVVERVIDEVIEDDVVVNDVVADDVIVDEVVADEVEDDVEDEIVVDEVIVDDVEDEIVVDEVVEGDVIGEIIVDEVIEDEVADEIVVDEVVVDEVVEDEVIDEVVVDEVIEDDAIDEIAVDEVVEDDAIDEIVVDEFIAGEVVSDEFIHYELYIEEVIEETIEEEEAIEEVEEALEEAIEEEAIEEAIEADVIISRVGDGAEYIVE